MWSPLNVSQVIVFEEQLSLNGARTMKLLANALELSQRASETRSEGVTSAR